MNTYFNHVGMMHNIMFQITVIMISLKCQGWGIGGANTNDQSKCSTASTQLPQLVLKAHLPFDQI